MHEERAEENESTSECRVSSEKDVKTNRTFLSYLTYQHTLINTRINKYPKNIQNIRTLRTTSLVAHISTAIFCGGFIDQWLNQD